jgi:hypothetical protein
MQRRVDSSCMQTTIRHFSIVNKKKHVVHEKAWIRQKILCNGYLRDSNTPESGVMKSIQILEKLLLSMSNGVKIYYVSLILSSRIKATTGRRTCTVFVIVAKKFIQCLLLLNSIPCYQQLSNLQPIM